MSTPTKHIRHGFGAVRAYLYGNLDLRQFVKEVLGAVELESDSMGEGAYHIEAKIGDSIIVLELGELPPNSNPTRASVYVYVEDVDTAYQRALELGAKSIAAPEEKPYQERGAGFQDTYGNIWWISTFKG